MDEVSSYNRDLLLASFLGLLKFLTMWMWSMDQLSMYYIKLNLLQISGPVSVLGLLEFLAMWMWSVTQLSLYYIKLNLLQAAGPVSSLGLLEFAMWM